MSFSKMNKNQKKDCYNVFNHAIKDLIDDIIIAFPNCSEFKAIKIAYKIFKKINRVYPQKQFDEVIAKTCSAYITNRDDTGIKSYIIQYNSTLDSSDIASGIIKKAQLALIDKWDKLDADQKNIIWNHLEHILRINDICNKHANGTILK